ncbi:aminotransferase class I/II-fold pyridoxal phosphate-dependent enzyme [Halioxenophilus aromaticivorans]|jgi:DNA-binding transcriptional MocR family regulator|uniref:Aminotransferase class I/II-fold pyridoxal phosphate-dependent enzyme n=1 Tax=Halioxenophilus aromaticivorans TaxID=1306992 RepID=A0AAV3U7A8_9ALTE|tara:strand:- start:3622 stop:4872 length:1251 start_codon:yes stop_codon:yes gene_type:complete
MNMIDTQLKDFCQKNTIQNQQLNMARGNPCQEQLDLSNELLTCVNKMNCITRDGVDVRNYGGIDGINEAKDLFSKYMDVNVTEIIVAGNSSLNLMYNALALALIQGTTNGPGWLSQGAIKFLCPTPGYDRHFSLCESLGIQMIAVPLNEDGPDMDIVENLVKSDHLIKGIWCVPKYSNPTGICYSDETINRLAFMDTAAGDFRIFCDNAYAVHHLGNKGTQIANLLEACKLASNPERAYLFGSTSKLTFPGAGVAMVAASEKNISYFRKQLGFQTIGPDKINQLRHVNFFQDIDGLMTHANLHANILRKKFDVILDVFDQYLSSGNLASWRRPDGGYFISVNLLPGCAKKVVDLAKTFGLTLTPAGATFPYGYDAEDRNIRIAPSSLTVEDAKLASEILCKCIVSVSSSVHPNLHN